MNETPLPPDNENHPTDDQLTRKFEYSEGASIPEIHGAILREQAEPRDGMEPVPLWLVLLFGVVVFWAGAYMAYYSGGFKFDVYDESAAAPGNIAGGPAAAQAVDPVAAGKRLFVANCAACHQSSGLGVPGQYPPLAASDIVLDKGGYGENHLARLMLNGLAGPIPVAGTSYNGNMPAWKDVLTDEQIANILTYIRQDWGNKAGPITKEGIAAARKEVDARTQPWTDGELKVIPAAPLVAATAPAPAAPAKK